MNNNEPVLFSTWGKKYAPPEVVLEGNISNALIYPKISEIKLNSDEASTEILVRFNDVLYGKSFGIIDYAKLPDEFIGKIDKLIDSDLVPMLNGETNSEEILEALVCSANDISMVLFYNNEAVLFRKIEGFETHSFIGTVLEETTTYMIVEPNEDTAERKSSDKIRINLNAPYKDYLYGVGRKVIINYTGLIKETYPAQITTDNIDVDGYDDFEISVKVADKRESKKILNNNELSKYTGDYVLHYVGLEEVNVKVDNKDMTLEKALRDGYLTLEGIIAKCNRDVKKVEESYDRLNAGQAGMLKLPIANYYKDGGSADYNYGDYKVIKCHTLDGNRDVYICASNTTLNDLNI